MQKPLLEFQKAKLAFEAELRADPDMTHAIVRPTAFFKSLGGQVEMIGVVYQDEPDTIRGFLAKHGSWGPALLDYSGSTSVAYGVTGVPETFVLDKSGRIHHKFTGPVSAEELYKKVKEVM